MSGETRLEQFLLLAKRSKGLATAKAIQQATEEPSLFVFGELLDLPSVQEVSPSFHYCPLIFLTPRSASLCAETSLLSVLEALLV